MATAECKGDNVVRERGSGVTPNRVVELLKKEVDDKSMLAVSRATGLGLAAIGRYLKGIGEPTTATLQKLADYFDVHVEFLRGGISYNEMILLKEVDGIYDEIIKLQELDGLPLKALPILDSIGDKFAEFAKKRASVENTIELEECKREEIVSKRVESEFEALINEIDNMLTEEDQGDTLPSVAVANDSGSGKKKTGQK